MLEKHSLSDLTREELYGLVWSTPATKLAKQFGVSDVAIFKHCQRLGVPRPERGYWRRLEFGKAAQRPELPAPPVPPAEVSVQAMQKPIAMGIALPTEVETLHPLAAQFLASIKSSALSYDKQRVHLQTPELPEAEISKAQAPRAARALHALLNLIEPRGIPFRKNQSKYGGGYFKKGNDRLHFKIEEELIDKPETPGRRRSSYYSSWQQEHKVAGGHLTFSLNPENYGKQQEKRWSESEKVSLESIVAEIAKEICRHYAERQRTREAEAIQREKDRIESEIRWKKHQEEEAVRLQKEARQKHAAKLEKTARTRQEDLLKAAEWWRLYQGTENFIGECECRWRAAQSDLSAEQQAWLVWAREVAKGISPFECGYPDPSKDGAFDPAVVPFGGPYPQKRKFPQPPTMPEIPAPVVVHQGYGAPSQQPAPPPYPFWLKYQRR
jgi:hypothetical protein